MVFWQVTIRTPNAVTNPLNDQVYDIAIIGGGINGCGIARDAAGRGLSVLLLEKDDLASGTSSASSKMIHGGLRYLEQYEFMLVRKALQEREVLLSMAPHIIAPLRLVLPHNSALRPKWMIRIGLFLYDMLGGRKLLEASRQIDLRADVAGGPLKPEFTYGFEYSDCIVDDARLVVLNAVDAKQRGADIFTRCQLQKAFREADHWRLETKDVVPDTTRNFKARILVNAAGPWVSEVVSDRVMLDTKSDVRLVKGSHIVVPKLYDHDRAYIFQNADNRVIFAIPFQQQFTMIGTTDVDITGDPGAAKVSTDEINYLCQAASEYFVKPVKPQDVIWEFSGIRPLFDDGESSASETTRDYVLEILATGDKPPLLSIFGGKITTYRRLAEAVFDKLQPWLPDLKPDWTAKAVLPGGDFNLKDRPAEIEKLNSDFSFLPEKTIHRLFLSYGTKARQILGQCKSEADLGRHFGADLYQREVEYLMEKEWALTADDIVWRRSKTGLFMSEKEISALDSWLKS